MQVRKEKDYFIEVGSCSSPMGNGMNSYRTSEGDFICLFCSLNYSDFLKYQTNSNINKEKAQDHGMVTNC